MTRRCTFLVNALTTGRIALWLAFDQLAIEPDKWYRRRQVILIRDKKGIVIRKAVKTSKEDISCILRQELVLSTDSYVFQTIRGKYWRGYATIFT